MNKNYNINRNTTSGSGVTSKITTNNNSVSSLTENNNIVQKQIQQQSTSSMFIPKQNRNYQIRQTPPPPQSSQLQKIQDDQDNVTPPPLKKVKKNTIVIPIVSSPTSSPSKSKSSSSSSSNNKHTNNKSVKFKENEEIIIKQNKNYSTTTTTTTSNSNESGNIIDQQQQQQPNKTLPIIIQKYIIELIVDDCHRSLRAVNRVWRKTSDAFVRALTVYFSDLHITASQAYTSETFQSKLISEYLSLRSISFVNADSYQSVIGVSRHLFNAYIYPFIRNTLRRCTTLESVTIKGYPLSLIDVTSNNKQQDGDDDSGDQDYNRLLRENRITLNTGNTINFGPLVHLDLSKNNINVNGVKALGAYLAGSSSGQLQQQQNQLESLDLSYNTLGVDGAKKLAKSLAGHQVLAQLDLSFNRICNDGFEYLVIALRKNRIQQLVLQSNQIDNRCAKTLLQLLVERSAATTVPLTNINLATNRFGITGFKDTFHSLSKYNRIQIIGETTIYSNFQQQQQHQQQQQQPQPPTQYIDQNVTSTTTTTNNTINITTKPTEMNISTLNQPENTPTTTTTIHQTECNINLTGNKLTMDGATKHLKTFQEDSKNINKTIYKQISINL
ncbi:hypothetical protein PPL_00122 [Heterostelium album PN500]|uniref:Leucine-rich repeat-containing protein n=1 Tax=Heterostelium pallidum (strain ATCC 26659 / Pp 5 / PN500) TaxID=670386 RepID=D3AVK8_HETP5|nr:hypothetical protein PPL_00122 [Heterostelium album PN500]EFA86331.1 hypothetical protein PPL_00122 [Heterostelium album PN500]|eukprot:XP_020438436.1 hypothetical protein PPL_00122 [Heterostelium album PN500]